VAAPWLFDSTPGLAHVPADEAARLWQKAVAQAKRGPHLFVFPAALFFCSVIFPQMIVPHLNVPQRGLGHWSILLGATLIVSLLTTTGYMVLVSRRSREYLRAELRAAGRCVECGYDLRETPQRCPECGTAVHWNRDG
jgi:hypothetical protein